ncbi:Gfo/Idh/MocA family oxidoreductase [soil metagenome]
MRIAFIGLGAATHNIHLPACRLLGDRVQVVAGCDPDPVARERARTTWKVPAVYDDPATMLKGLEADWVVIVTPPSMHRAHAELALGAGFHVFCEKPLAESLEDADAMIAAARAAGRQLVVNNEFPYMACHLAAHEAIGGPEFGKLLFVHASHTMRPSAHTEAGWRGALRRRVGFEFSIHVLDLARFLFGEDPVRLYAHMPRPDPRVDSDAINLITLEFANGRSCSIVLDRLSKGPERYLDMRLDGEHAAIHTSLGGRLDVSLGLHTRARRPFARVRMIRGGHATLQTGDSERILARDGFDLFAAATARLLGRVFDAVAAGERIPAEASDNRRSLALVFAAYDSANTGAPVDLAGYLTPG